MTLIPCVILFIFCLALANSNVTTTNQELPPLRQDNVTISRDKAMSILNDIRSALNEYVRIVHMAADNDSHIFHELQPIRIINSSSHPEIPNERKSASEIGDMLGILLLGLLLFAISFFFLTFRGQL